MFVSSVQIALATWQGWIGALSWVFLSFSRLPCADSIAADARPALVIRLYAMTRKPIDIQPYHAI
jgi:hypothetical protein